ncbi:hypothetical protein BON30_08900 [Cystobacter ferrugineus]|uniref:DUF3987 domain-containing protein n=2 Tax=Cystobacter ferrugineus TaxID=83449 RepID=A0A1L9BFM3_9BACT|nr:hypothetical protein BON30_08900 [Cystobacter ferrugineus]
MGGMDANARRRAGQRPPDLAKLPELTVSDAQIPTTKGGVRMEQPPARLSLQSPALHGLAGDLVRTIEPHTEADPAAILVQFLVAAGNAMGRSPFFKVEATRHHTNLFAAIVGQSAKARKGTSWSWVERVLATAEPEWGPRLQKGLSSGEGLIHAVRDGAAEDPGVTDKRLTVIESEFSSVLRRMNREGNSLSAILREAWDSGSLQVLTKGTPQRATEAHLSVVTHITIPELRALLSATDMSNGLANRFLWVFARRSKLLPEGGRLEDGSLSSLSSRLARVLSWARDVGEMKRSEAARKLWCEVYESLSSDKPGLFGQATSRAEAQVVRLSLLYALLARSEAIDEEHLSAALALMDYASDSARHIFGGAQQNPRANRILEALRERPEGRSRSELVKLFTGHVTRAELDMALGSLSEAGAAHMEEQPSGGRPTERWFHGAAAAKEEKKAKYPPASASVTERES